MNSVMEIDEPESNMDMDIETQTQIETPTDPIKKIAFCFLTYDLIIRNDIWNKFFEGIDYNKYSVFIHAKNIINYNQFYYTFQYQYVKNPVYTKSKSDISIVKATLQLLKEAYISDQSITHFIFLSQSCIPLYNFKTIYEKINKMNNSIISCIQKNKLNRYNLLDPSMKRYIHPNLFLKQQPNMMLIRDDVSRFIREDYTEYFKELECPDEHYFINIMINLFKKRFIIKQITFCNPILDRTQALEFNNINNDFINTIKGLGFLFMRKVGKNSNISIDF